MCLESAHAEKKRNPYVYAISVLSRFHCFTSASEWRVLDLPDTGKREEDRFLGQRKGNKKGNVFYAHSKTDGCYSL